MKKHILIILAFLISLQITPCDNTCPFKEEWTILTESATATIYHACRKQCNKDYLHTASMYKVKPKHISKQRILAMERTMMDKYGIKYGDIVYLKGTDSYDGIWQVQDTMNKRFAGQEKIDLLMPKSIKYGKWENVQISIAANPYTQHIHSYMLDR